MERNFRWASPGGYSFALCLLAVMALSISPASSFTYPLQRGGKNSLLRSPRGRYCPLKKPPRCWVKAAATNSNSLSEIKKEQQQQQQQLGAGVGLLNGSVDKSTVLGIVLTAVILAPAVQSAPTLFVAHVAGMAVGSLVFLLAALGAVRSRTTAARAQPPPNRRSTLNAHIKTHFLLYLANVFAWGAGMASIVLLKTRQARPHLSSAHSRVGAAALFFYFLAWLAAEAKVFKQAIKEIKGNRFKFEPHFLWSSRWHRELGRLSGCTAVAAVASGAALTGYGRSNFALTTPQGAFVAAGLGVLGAQQLWALTTGVRGALKRRTASKA